MLSLRQHRPSGVRIALMQKPSKNGGRLSGTRGQPARQPDSQMACVRQGRERVRFTPWPSGRGPASVSSGFPTMSVVRIREILAAFETKRSPADLYDALCMLPLEDETSLLAPSGALAASLPRSRSRPASRLARNRPRPTGIRARWSSARWSPCAHAHASNRGPSLHFSASDDAVPLSRRRVSDWSTIVLSPAAEERSQRRGSLSTPYTL